VPLKDHVHRHLRCAPDILLAFERPRAPGDMTADQYRRAAALLCEDHPQDTPAEREHALVLATHFHIMATMIQRRQHNPTYLQTFDDFLSEFRRLEPAARQRARNRLPKFSAS
jgi:hypothetical protein